MKKIVVEVGGGKTPRLVDISTPLPPVKVIPGPLPKIEKPFLAMLEEMEKEIQMKENRPLGAEHAKSLWGLTDKILTDLNWIAPEDIEMRKTKVFNQLMLATSPLAKIHELMSGKEWGPDTLNAIAEVLRQSGFEIEEP